MAEMLLVHGSCYGAWAFDHLIPALERRGVRARAIDLPGRGGAPTSLAEQAKAIVAALDGPTVLVGHSAGGFAITAAAELAPDKVAGLIYLCAYVPVPGRSLADMRRAGPSQPLKGSFHLTADRSAYGFDPARAKALFFHDCPDPEAVIARLCLEPVAPQETAFPALHHAPNLPCAAIICTDDRAIPPAYQAQMAEGMAQTVLASGHSPFLSMPDRLAECLSAVCASFPESPR